MRRKLQKSDTEFFIPNLSFNIKPENHTYLILKLKTMHIFSVIRGARVAPLQSVCNVDPVRVIFSCLHTNNYRSLQSCGLCCRDSRQNPALALLLHLALPARTCWGPVQPQAQQCAGWNPRCLTQDSGWSRDLPPAPWPKESFPGGIRGTAHSVTPATWNEVLGLSPSRWRV